ncbi:uncharacterized protein LOC127277342 isoform X1 [Leptopilina boulardi]|uniref:uncharacterized protein LOC127277342 isoform X1 n=1 Tax=Leptopilina boulardi TaxID=63433 RepID=UPI0021F52392|nr:uncharacterized protein LOC127277342 isoform X1 [Leptopilina boulardi]
MYFIANRTTQKLYNLVQDGEKKFSKPDGAAALYRRNGLDPNLAELQGKEGKWKYLKSIRAVQKPNDSSADFKVQKPNDSSSADLKFQKHNFSPDFKFQKPNDSSTDFKIVANKMERNGKKSNEKINKRNRNYFQQIPLPSAEELISDYRKYLSEAQLKKYQYCSSRRNGLQDECYLSVPRAVVQLKIDEMKKNE